MNLVQQELSMLRTLPADVAEARLSVLMMDAVAEIRDPAAMLIEPLINEALADLDELRWRLSGMPNPMYEDQDGECLHLDTGCSWRCLKRVRGDHAPTDEEVREYLSGRLGPALFAVIDGDGDDVRSIVPESVINILQETKS